jgi:uncharacterized protein
MDVIDSLKNEVYDLMINDSAHDFEHVMRVFKNAQNICKKKMPTKNLFKCVCYRYYFISKI